MDTGRAIHCCALKVESRRHCPCASLLAKPMSYLKGFTLTLPQLLLEAEVPSLCKTPAKTAVFLLTVVLLASPTAEGTKVKPNLVFVLADDVGWDDVSFHGSTQIPTPNLDALAADGVILNSYYVQPYCTPSRAALMTGLYPIRTGMQGLPIGAAQPWGLPKDVKIMPQYLKELGYDTHLVGKWHLGSYTKSVTPACRGFDSFYGFYYGEEDYYSGMMTAHNRTGLDFWLNNDPLWLDNKTYSSVLYSRRAEYIIKNRQKSKPLLLVMSYQTAHSTGGVEQLQAPQENTDKFPYIGEKNRTIFAGMVDAMDQSVGRVFRALGDAGMLENTVIVFSSDNGGALWGDHNSRGVNWPLRGAKGTVWEGGTRAAGFIWSPLLAWKRRVSNELMHITDWLPTFYSVAGGNSAKLKGLDGYDMWRQLSSGRRSPRTEMLYNIDYAYTNISGIRNSRYKLVLDYNGMFNQRYPVPGGSRPFDDLDKLMAQSTVAAVLRKLYWRDVRFSKGWRRKAALTCGKGIKQNFPSNTSVYLFDVIKDPCELNNLADSHQNVVSSLKKRIDFYQAAAVPVRNKPVDPAGYPENNNGTWAPWLPSA